jgi:CarboxypepD_reg-like domain
MNRFIFSFLLICCGMAAFAQTKEYTVRGRVVDAASKNPLNNASVFCQNTTLGTLTDSAGRFRLKVPNGGYDLVATYTGYESGSVRISTDDKDSVVLELKVKDKAMEAVVIQSSNEVKDGWEKYGSFFLEKFLGKTVNAAKCTLQNPEVLKFFYSKRRNRLKVLSNQELVIKNDALGYMIKCQLDSFIYEYGSDVSMYAGFPFFEKMHGTFEEQAAWNANRTRAYEGSMLHFMRSYYDKALEEDGFVLRLMEKETDAAGALVKQPYDSAYYRSAGDVAELQFTKPLLVTFIHERPERSYLDHYKLPLTSAAQNSVLKFVAGKKLIIEQNGFYYEQDDVTITGYFGWEQVADMLPYDYEPEQ